MGDNRVAYIVELSKSAEKFLAKHNTISDRILEKLRILEQNPYNNTLDIQPLQGHKNHYRLRVGKYRILYEIIESCILIYAYDIDSRGDIYK